MTATLLFSDVNKSMWWCESDSRVAMSRSRRSRARQADPIEMPPPQSPVEREDQEMTHVAELSHLFHHGHDARHDSRGVLVRHSHRALEAGGGAGGGGAAATGPGVVATKVLARPAPGRRGSRGRAATGLLVDARHDGGGVLTAGRRGSIGGRGSSGRGSSGRGRGLATHHGVHTGHHVIDVTTGRRRSRV